MKKFIDGNQMVFTLDTFENLQESPAVFVSLDDENVQAILEDGGLYAASGEFLSDVIEDLAEPQALNFPGTTS